MLSLARNLGKETVDKWYDDASLSDTSKSKRFDSMNGTRMSLFNDKAYGRSGCSHMTVIKPNTR